MDLRICRFVTFALIVTLAVAAPAHAQDGAYDPNFGSVGRTWIDVTSDSLAAWLAGTLHAARLLLVKHIAGAGTMEVRDLVARGLLDPEFPRFLTASGVPAFLLGPADHVALADMGCGQAVDRRVLVA